jgi:PAS domain S-box-containing protein
MMKRPADAGAVGAWLRIVQAPWVIVPLIAVTVLLAVTAASIGLHLRQDLREIRDAHFDHLVLHAGNARLALSAAGGEAIDERHALLLRQLFPETSSFAAALIDRDLTVVASSVPAWRGADIRALVHAGQSLPLPRTTSHAGADIGPRLHVYLPWASPDAVSAVAGNDAPAWLYVELDIEAGLKQQTVYLLRKFSVVGTLIVLGGVLLGWWLRSHLQRPLERVLRAAQALRSEGRTISRKPAYFHQLHHLAECLDRSAEDLKATNAALARHRQSLALAAACSSAMFRAGDASQAAQAICTTLVDFGFSAAWIGRLEDRAGQGMGLLARAGGCDHLAGEIGAVLPGMQISLGVDIPAGRVERVPLTAVEAAAPDWLNVAARNGCVEMMLVPIVREGRNVGVLTLLGRATDAFEEPLGPLLLGVCEGLGIRLADLALRVRQAELQRQLDHERSRLRAVIDSIPEPIFFKDRASVYLGCNPAFARLSNRSEAGIVGGTAFDIFPSDLAAKFHRDDGDVLADGGMHRVEEWVDYPDGRQLLLESVKTPYRDADGRVLGLVGISRDITQQYEAMHALERERSLFVAGPTVVFRWAPTAGWPVLYVSPNVQEQFGYAPEALTGGRPGYAEIVHPGDRERVADEVAGHLARPGCGHFEQRYRVRHADGRYRWVFDQTMVIRDPGGEVTTLQGYLIDVTATVDLEQRLGERIKELNGLYGTMQILAGMPQDIHAAFKAVVDAIPASFRYPCAIARLTYAGVAYASGRFAASLPRIGAAWRSAQGKEGRLDIGYAALPEDVEGSLFLPEERDFLAAMASELARFVDRAELSESERAAVAEIEIREQRFRAVAEISRDFIYDYDPASGRRSWFGRARAALGYDESHDDAFATDWPSYIHPDDLPLGRRAMEIVRDGGTDFDVTYRVRSAIGDWQHWHDRGRVVDGDPGGCKVVGSCADVTGIVAAAEHRALIDRRLRMGERLETLGLLAKGMTTDLNRKLMAVEGYAGILAKRLAKLPAEKAVAYLGKIQAAADEAAAIVREIDRFSDVSDQQAFPLQVKPLVDTCVALLRPTFPASVTIDVSIDPGLPSFLARQSEVQQALLSLCLYVRRAVGERGRLAIVATLADLRDGVCTVCGSAFDGEWIEVAVTASGPGASVAEPPARTGSGQVGPRHAVNALGLETVHRLAPQLGGHLVARNAPDGSAGYALYLKPILDRRDERGETGRPDDTAQAGMGNGRLALVLDDDPGTLELLNRQLELLGFDVAGFASAAEAIARMRADNGKIAVAVIDENLGEGRGSRVAARIREVASDLPVVIVSGYFGASSEVGIDRLQPAALLAKPYRLSDLGRVLGALLRPV